jgi:hypothetical protein
MASEERILQTVHNIQTNLIGSIENLQKNQMGLQSQILEVTEKVKENHPHGPINSSNPDIPSKIEIFSYANSRKQLRRGKIIYQDEDD